LIGPKWIFKHQKNEKTVHIFLGVMGLIPAIAQHQVVSVVNDAKAKTVKVSIGGKPFTNLCTRIRWKNLFSIRSMPAMGKPSPVDFPGNLNPMTRWTIPIILDYGSITKT